MAAFGVITEAWELYRQRQQGWWAVLAGLGVAFQCLGAPQFVVYDGLVMLVWMGLDLWEQRSDRRLLARNCTAAAGVALLGIALASWQLLPSFELASDSHRSLLGDAGSFASYARAAPRELLLALSAESFWLFERPPTLVYGAPYPNLPNLSLVTLGFAVFAAFGARRRRLEWLAVAFFLLGMLGAAGGVTTLLGWIVPFADRIRAPIRMIVPAGFLLSWLAANGFGVWLRSGQRWRTGAAALAVAWLGLLGFSLQFGDDIYVDRDAFEVPPIIGNAEPRVAVDPRSSSADLPLFAVNAGLGAGVPSLLTRAALRPRNYFEALFASQQGSFDQRRKLEGLVHATVLGFTDPTLPLLRSFGLKTLVGYRDGRFESLPIPDPTPRFYLARRVHFLPDARARRAMAAASDWDPLLEVISSRPIPAGRLPSPEGGGDPTEVKVLVDRPDEQLLEVASDGGVLVTSELFYPGWQVRVDSEPAEPLEVNLALRAVVLPPGRHRVEWRYRPTWLSAARASTGLAAAIALAMGLLLRPGAILTPPSRG